MGFDNDLEDFDENFFREIDKAVQFREERRENHPNPCSGDYQVDDGVSGHRQLEKYLVDQEEVGQSSEPSLIQMKNFRQSGSQNVCTYRWAAESISVRDGLEAAAEVVGKVSSSRSSSLSSWDVRELNQWGCASHSAFRLFIAVA